MYTNPGTFIIEEDNYSEEILKFTEKFRQKHHVDSTQIQSVRRISNINTLDLSSSVGNFVYEMNSNTNFQGSLYMDICSNTSTFLLHENSFTEVSRTLRSVTLVGFKKDLQSKSIFIGSV